MNAKHTPMRQSYLAHKLNYFTLVMGTVGGCGVGETLGRAWGKKSGKTHHFFI